MPRFVCHACKVAMEVRGPVSISQAWSIRCPRCGGGMFWKPEGSGPGGIDRDYAEVRYPAEEWVALPFGGGNVPSGRPGADETPGEGSGTGHDPPLLDREVPDPDRSWISEVWTPGTFGDAYANAVRHWHDHRHVNGVTHPTVGSYVTAARAFYGEHKGNRVPQLKNPRVEYVHNCTRYSGSASLLVVNVEGTKRFSSFYDMTPGRNGRSLQKQISDLTGVDEGILFP
jgi:DNA-directed RNA polymerase subunit RPC12/RpoP